MHIRYLLNDNNFIYISKTRIDKEFESFIHMHNNLEILFVNEGEGFINFVKDKIEIKKGDLIIVNKGSKHIEVSNSYLDFFAIGIRNASILNKFSNEDNLIKINLNKELETLKEAQRQMGAYNSLTDEQKVASVATELKDAFEGMTVKENLELPTSNVNKYNHAAPYLKKEDSSNYSLTDEKDEYFVNNYFDINLYRAIFNKADHYLYQRSFNIFNQVQGKPILDENFGLYGMVIMKSGDNILDIFDNLIELENKENI